MRQRDYRRGAGRRPRGGGFSGWTGLGLGLALGLAVAVGVWRLKSAVPADTAAVKLKKPPQSARDEADKEPPPRGTEYTFYDRLKNYELVIPEKEKDVHRDVKPALETRPGTYVLQAGSYRNPGEADAVHARLALQGVESKVQKVTVDQDTWYRVRIGPITNLDELNRTRTRLKQAEIDALLIRVGD